LGPLLFLTYINDLPNAVEPTAIPVMLADDTSILIKSPTNVQLQGNLNSVMDKLNGWFQYNLITLNLRKTYFFQFINKSICFSDIQLKIDNKYIAAVIKIKFLALIIDNKLSWKEHINHVFTKLSSACNCIRAVKPYVAHNTLKIIYYSHFHSIMTYGLLFWESLTESIRIFKLQKKVIRVMMGYKCNQSCRDLFVKL
jgi:hypothetical protein